MNHYERIAHLEVALKLRDQRRRRHLLLSIFAALLTTTVFTGYAVTGMP